MDMTKDELVAAVEAAGETVPSLSELAANASSYNKQPFIDEAERRLEEAASQQSVVEDGDLSDLDMTEVDADDLFDHLLSEMPGAVIAPKRQAYLRIPHPTFPEDSFVITAFQGTMGSRQISLDEYTRSWRDANEDDTPDPYVSEMNTTSLSEVPRWARETVLELIEAEEIHFFKSEEEAARSERGPKEERTTILDNDTGEVRLELRYPDRAGGDRRPILEPIGKFKKAEQEAAWNVLNGDVRGERPLPRRTEDVTAEPANITDAEIRHVADRIKDCLENPAHYIEKRQVPMQFDKRAFFNQLLKTEMAGFTPRRPGVVENKIGGTRPDIVRVIRAIAKDHGFEPMSDYFVRRQDRETIPDLTPDQDMGSRQAVPQVAQFADRFDRTR